MADIKAFKGVLYAPEKAGDISKVVAPPYDVISPEAQEELHSRSPYNIIRILLGRDAGGDSEQDNKYTRAAAFLKEWQEKGVLKRDSEECIYVYLQEFSVEGEKKSRLGFLALLKLEDFHKDASVYPHENTLDGPKADRTNLITRIEANLGPVFAVFADEEKKIQKELRAVTEGTPPIIDILDSQGIRNKLWRLSDRGLISRITAFMKDKKIFIADGHHRYEVALAFSKTKKDPRYGYILTYFTDIFDDGIVVLPVHRLISGPAPEDIAALKARLLERFTMHRVGSPQEAKAFLRAAERDEKRYVFYDGSGFTGLALKDAPSLDMTVLHDLIVEPLRRIAKEKGREIFIDFTKDFGYAIDMVNKGRCALSVMLNPTRITQIKDMALSGRRMPQKSTYFYPKVLTGLVINVF